jgi:hypothetical protein
MFDECGERGLWEGGSEGMEGADKVYCFSGCKDPFRDVLHECWCCTDLVDDPVFGSLRGDEEFGVYLGVEGAGCHPSVKRTEICL